MGRSSTRVDRVLDRLAYGPATADQLADLLTTHSGDIARMMHQLREKGRVTRIDGSAGRGSIALYALPAAATMPANSPPMVAAHG